MTENNFSYGHNTWSELPDFSFRKFEECNTKQRQTTYILIKDRESYIRFLTLCASHKMKWRYNGRHSKIIPLESAQLFLAPAIMIIHKAKCIGDCEVLDQWRGAPLNLIKTNIDYRYDPNIGAGFFYC